jgi:hypothetical protein
VVCRHALLGDEHLFTAVDDEVAALLFCYVGGVILLFWGVM